MDMNGTTTLEVPTTTDHGIHPELGSAEAWLVLTARVEDLREAFIQHADRRMYGWPEWQPASRDYRKAATRTYRSEGNGGALINETLKTACEAWDTCKTKDDPTGWLWSIFTTCLADARRRIRQERELFVSIHRFAQNDPESPYNFSDPKLGPKHDAEEDRLIERLDASGGETPRERRAARRRELAYDLAAGVHPHLPGILALWQEGMSVKAICAQVSQGAPPEDQWSIERLTRACQFLLMELNARTGVECGPEEG